MLRHKSVLRLQLLASLGAACLALASNPARADQAPAKTGTDITTMCGTKPATVALIDGFGGDTWRKLTREEFLAEVAKCPNIKKTLYADASGDQQKYNSAINSFVAQGVDIILAFTDFGDATIPAYRSAKKAGVIVVPYFSKIDGTPGKDYDANVYQDQGTIGKLWGDWMGKRLQSGNVVFLGGTAGATSSQHFLEGFKEGIKNYPGLKLLDDNYIVTNWNPADGQKAVAGLIAKYPKIDGIASDYGVTTLAGIKAFEQAGLAVPAQATLASINELNCKYLDDKKAGRPFQYFTLDGTNLAVRYALRRALSIFEGSKDDDPMAFVPFVYADSAQGLDPKCDPTAPPDADLSSSLSEDKLKAIFQH